MMGRKDSVPVKARAAALRPVDIAMNKNLLAKQSIRNLWAREVKAALDKYPEIEVPYFLTLSGAEGKDIELLISEGYISLTETMGISEKDQSKIVAVESNNLAISNLQKKFVGLKIKEVNFSSLIRGDGQFSWPNGEDEEICCAKVVNLDFDQALSAREEGNHHINFPVLEWIRKLCLIHAKKSHLDWTLCLTFNGTINWSKETSAWVRAFLIENFERESSFAKKCLDFFGESLFSKLHAPDVEFSQLNPYEQQKMIMTIVPKMINRLVHNEGWNVKTEDNLWYGGGENALMVTWVIRFFWDKDATPVPDTIYKTSLRSIFDGLGKVLDDGHIERQTL